MQACNVNVYLLNIYYFCKLQTSQVDLGGYSLRNIKSGASVYFFNHRVIFNPRAASTMKKMQMAAAKVDSSILT